MLNRYKTLTPALREVQTVLDAVKDTSQFNKSIFALQNVSQEYTTFLENLEKLGYELKFDRLGRAIGVV